MRQENHVTYVNMERNVKTVLALDLSTSSTGWAIFNAETKKPGAYGYIVPKIPGKAKMGKLERTLQVMLHLAKEIEDLVQIYNPELIVIEEITGGKNRLAQKTLNGFHWIVLSTIRAHFDKIVFFDVTGADGWRKHLKLTLSDADRLHNKEAKTLNKRLPSNQQIPEVTPKTLAARHVNAKFGLALDVDRNPHDNDVADALALGDAFLTFKMRT